MNSVFRGIFILMMFAPFFTAVAQKTHVSCSKSVHNFGVIEENGGNVTHSFLLKNEGKTPLFISNVSTSCGCTTPEYPKAPIAVGDSAFIKITFNPKNRPGAFMKMARVYYNNAATPLILSVCGVVKKAEPAEE